MNFGGGHGEWCRIDPCLKCRNYQLNRNSSNMPGMFMLVCFVVAVVIVLVAFASAAPS